MEITTLVLGKLLNNTYIITTKQNNAVIIDPSVDFERIYSELLKSGANLKYIMFTHGHYDHTASAYELKQKTGAKTVIHSRDAEMLSDFDKSMSWMFTNKPQKVECDIAVNDGDTLKIDELEFRFLNTPGHSKGSMVILLNDIMFSGDTVIKGSVGRCDFYGGSENLMRQSIKRLAELDKDYKIYCGHYDRTTLYEEKENNIFFKEYA